MNIILTKPSFGLIRKENILDDALYKEKWQPVFESIFKTNTAWLPERVFHDDFKIYLYWFSNGDDRDHFPALFETWKDLGEEEIVIIPHLCQEETERKSFKKEISDMEEMLDMYCINTIFGLAFQDYTRFVWKTDSSYEQFSFQDITETPIATLIYPYQYYCFGQSGDWGLVFDEGWVMGLLAVRNEAVAKTFVEKTGHLFVTQEQLKMYLQTQVPDWMQQQREALVEAYKLIA